MKRKPPKFSTVSRAGRVTVNVNALYAAKRKEKLFRPGEAPTLAEYLRRRGRSDDAGTQGRD